MMIDTFIDGIQAAACAGLAVIAAIALGAFLGRSARVLRRVLRPAQMAALVVVAAACLVYGRKSGRVTFPRTDADIAYLTDRGSFVTNDYVHIDFSRIIAPIDAHVFVDYRQLDMTNDTDWATLIDSTFAEFNVPTNVPFANATNYDWMVYTTWTPGPAVLTNGVWHAMWGLDKRGKFYLIPVRTAVRVDGDTIATPKSREDARDEE